MRTQPGDAFPVGQAEYLIRTAARAPSVHNTQPWRFRTGRYAIELYADLRRKLRVDPAGRELHISCGAALFGLRLAVRSLGFLPVAELLPDPARPRPLARVKPGAVEPMSAQERQMLEALPHRHTHRGPFDPGPLLAGLAAGLQHDALAEGAILVLIDKAIAYGKLADIVGAAVDPQDHNPVAREEVRRWSRSAADGDRYDPGSDPRPPGPARPPADTAATWSRSLDPRHRPPPPADVIEP